MDATTATLEAALDDIAACDCDERRTALAAVEAAIGRAEDYYCRPVESRAVYEKLAAALDELDDTAAAVAYRERVAQMDADLYEFKGRLQSFFGDQARAVGYYEQALEYQPDHPDAKKGLKRAQNRVAKSKKGLKRLVRKATGATGAQPTIDLARALADLGRTDEALEAYNAALEVDPENVEALARKGALLEGRGKFEAAMPLFEAALAHNPKSMLARRGINYAQYYFSHPDSDYYDD